MRAIAAVLVAMAAGGAALRWALWPTGALVIRGMLDDATLLMATAARHAGHFGVPTLDGVQTLAVPSPTLLWAWVGALAAWPAWPEAELAARTVWGLLAVAAGLMGALAGRSGRVWPVLLAAALWLWPDWTAVVARRATTAAAVAAALALVALVARAEAAPRTRRDGGLGGGTRAALLLAVAVLPWVRLDLALLAVPVVLWLGAFERAGAVPTALAALVAAVSAGAARAASAGADVVVPAALGLSDGAAPWLAAGIGLGLWMLGRGLRFVPAERAVGAIVALLLVLRTAAGALGAPEPPPQPERAAALALASDARRLLPKDAVIYAFDPAIVALQGGRAVHVLPPGADPMRQPVRYAALRLSQPPDVLRTVDAAQLPARRPDEAWLRALPPHPPVQIAAVHMTDGGPAGWYLVQVPVEGPIPRRPRSDVN